MALLDFEKCAIRCRIASEVCGGPENAKGFFIGKTTRYAMLHTHWNDGCVLIGTADQYYNYYNIKPIPLGPHTPWPNRAEAGVRQFSIVAKIYLESIQHFFHIFKFWDFENPSKFSCTDGRTEGTHFSVFGSPK